MSLAWATWSQFRSSFRQMKEERKGCHLYKIFSISLLTDLILGQNFESQKYLNMVIYKVL